MVKGNWERRAELAALRREEEKLKKKEKQNKKDTANNNDNSIYEIYEILINNAQLKHSGAIIRVYKSNLSSLSLEDTDINSKQKKKKNEEDDEEINFYDLNKNDLKLVKEIFISKVCIFNRNDPSHWNKYCISQLSTTSTSEICQNNNVALPTIKEDEEETIEEIQQLSLSDSYNNNNNNTNDSNNKIISIISLIHFKAIFFEILDIKDLISFSTSCKTCKHFCYKNEIYRIKKKEAFATISSQISKLKKLDKKKKTKQANLKKKDKKDAFARGGNDGMH